MFKNNVFILFLFFPHFCITVSDFSNNVSASEPGNWDWAQVIQKGISYLIPIIDQEIANQKDAINKSILRIDETVQNNSKKIDDLTNTVDSLKVDILLLRSTVSNVGQVMTQLNDSVNNNFKKVNDNLELINDKLGIILPVSTTTAPVILAWIAKAKPTQMSTIPSEKNDITKEG